MKMDPPRVVVTAVRRRGRPALDDTSVVPAAAVHLKLPATEYDDAFKLAQRNQESVQDIIRRALKRLLLDERGI